MMTFLITFVIIFLLFRLVMPHLLRWALKAFVKKTIRNATFTQAGGPFGQAAGPFGQTTPPAPEGEVKVAFVPQDDAKKAPKEFRGGEYVEFEEVKENKN
ncbi:MAG: DUF4834 family protein [Adhaeribacter sp.]